MINFKKILALLLLAISTCMYAQLPLASPSVSGKVVTPALNSTTGTQGGGLWVNVVDKATNLVVAKVSVGSTGDFTIPTGNLVETYNYDFILSKNEGTVGSPAPAKELNVGWIIVEEGISSTTPDGVANSIFNWTAGAANLTGVRFAIKTNPCSIGTDSDGDGIADECDLDDDNDGITDCDENLLGANASVSNVFSFITAGTAIATSNNEVRLTQDTGNQAGQIWSVGKVDFTKSFVLRFDAYLGTHDGADGIAAVFHNSPQGVNATGATGLGIGARGIANGIVLELDTYNNGTGLGDMSSDHGQIWDSDNQSSTGFLTTAIALPELENGNWHPVVINWNATTKTISYTVDGTNAGTYTGDLVTNYFAGANKVYFGYTASTGGATNEQKIRINSFCSDLPLELDKDGDGTPNSLDLDSDGDGCFDAIEGGDNVTAGMLNGIGRINVAANGTTTPVVVDANGVPVVTNTGSTFNVDGQAQGQTIGQSQINNPAAVAGTVGSNQTIVSGSAPSALSLTGSTGTIQWQSSTDNVTFANISGATSASYSPGTMTSTTYYRAVVSSLGGCSVNTNSVVITVFSNTDSDGDGIPDSTDLDDDNDGILDTTEGQCINTSNPSTDGFDSPLVATVNGNNIQSTNPYNGWGAETGGANAFNVIRVNGAGYASGPDNAQSGNQYIDITATSAYVYKNITLTSPAVFSGSAWFANRESSRGGYAPWSTKIEIRNETTGITVAQGNTINFTSSISDEIWNNSSINSVALPAGTYRIRMYVGDFGHLDSISYCFSKDTDNDGTPNYLDLDSDGDGCPDAIEGGDNITQTMLNGSNAIGSNISGTLNSPAIATVDAYGVPVITNTGSTFNVDGQAQGQTIGQSQINNPAAVAGTVGSNQTIVSGSAPSALSLTGSTGTIQWQSSTDNVTFANISGATSASYSPGTMTSTTYYRAVVSSLGGCSVNTNSVVITVVPNNTYAIDDINNTFINTPVSGSVLTNDSDPQGHTQTVTASTTTTPEGTLVLNADGTYTFTPATDFTGTFVHTYTVCDSGTPQACDTATLTIEVMPNPNDPDATNDVVANDDTATTEEGQPVTINILSNDFDPNGDTLGTPTVVTPPTNGTFDPVTGVYTPNPGFVGVDTFVYQVCDDATPQACDTAVVTITVNPTNPVNTTDANDDAYNGDQYQPINGSVLDNDNDIEGNTQTVTSNTQPQNGTVVMNPDGTFVYTPTGEYSGPDQFTYTVCDNGTPQACDTATVYLTINPANTTNAENDINNTFMNIPVSGSVLTNDSDPQGHTQTVTASTTTTPEGTLVLNADGTYTFTPATDFTGTFVHTYTVCDSGTPQACDTATLTIEVMPNPNDPDATNDVVANDDTATTEEGQPVTINILSNDFDPNGDTLGTPTVVTPPTNGTFDPVTGVYTPNPGFVGVDTFVYQVCDDATPQACDTAVVTITVNPTNPVNTTDANDDAYNGDQYQPINGSVLDNDNDIEGNTQTVTSNTQPQNGTVVMNPDGTFVYTPTGEYSGPDQFTYTVCDNGTPQACDTATVYLTINPANTTNAENDINNTFMNIPVSGSVLTNDSDPQGHTQTVTASTTTTPEGTLVLNADGTYTFTPATDFTGTFVHTYTVCDSGTPQACDTATLTIEVMPNPNDPDATNDVVANDDTATTEEGQPVTINILSNDFDPNGDTLGTPTVVTPPTNGTFDPVTGVYTPNPGFVGVDTFVYQVCDDATPQACDTAVVTITVNPTNPVNTTDANDDAYNGDQYQPINGSVLDNDNDIEGNTQTVTSNTQPQNGTVVMNPDGTFVYTPTGEYSGPDQFTYTVCDNGTPQACDTATVYLTINPANTTNAENDINNTFMNIPVSGSVLTNDSDPQGHTQTVTASITTTPEGTLVLNANGTYTFTPATGFTGTFVHTYTVCDNGTPQACDTATLTIEVLPIVSTTNDVVANNDTATTSVDQPVTINILSNDFDPNGDTIGTPTIVTPPSNGTFDPLTGVYIPNPGFVGVDTFVYQICDDGTPQACDTAVVTITIVPTNITNETYANDDAYNGNGPTITGNILNNDTDPEGNTQFVTSNTQPQHGTVVVNLDGTFVYTPTPGYYGPDSFVYTICDNGTPQACDTATVYLTVNAAPAIVITKDSSLSGNVITYTYLVTNTGNVPLTGVSVLETAANFSGTGTLPNPVYVSSNPSAGSNTTTLAVGATSTYTATYTLTQADIDAGQVDNLATASGIDPTGVTITDDSSDPTPCSSCTPVDPTCTDCTIVDINQSPSIVITKDGTLDMGADGIANAGDVITYNFVVTNTGNVTLSNVVVNDPLLGLSAIAVTPGTLLPGAVGTASATYTITQDDIDAGQVDNLAVATGTDPSGNPVSDDSTDPTPCPTCTPLDPTCTDCTIVDINQSPSIVITKDGTLDMGADGIANAGDVITYNFVVTNTGNMSLFDVIVTDPLPGIVLTGGPIDLAVGQSDSTTFTATYTITQADIVFGSVVNQATASAETIDGEVVDDLSDDDSELEDDPTIVILEDCKLTIFNAVSPNGDGSNDIFYIQGIECYPNNTVEVYNRWGIKVYEVNNYDNISNVFKGYSDGRVTISRNELLPTGTYFYIIKYVDLNGNGIDKSGYLYIQSN